MRLSTTKLSGFKSFVEPLAANFGRRRKHFQPAPGATRDVQVGHQRKSPA